MSCDVGSQAHAQSDLLASTHSEHGKIGRMYKCNYEH